MRGWILSFVSETARPLALFFIAACAALFLIAACAALFLIAACAALFLIAACAAGPLPKGGGDLLLQSKMIRL